MSNPSTPDGPRVDEATLARLQDLTRFVQRASLEDLGSMFVLPERWLAWLQQNFQAVPLGAVRKPDVPSP